MTEPIRLLVADDHALFRRGVLQTLDTPEMTVVAEASTAAEALERARETLPDVLLLDVSMPGGSGLDILPEFREYERTLVTVMNAYVQPKMRNYLKRFEQKLREIDFTPHVNIVRSDGGRGDHVPGPEARCPWLHREGGGGGRPHRRRAGSALWRNVRRAGDTSATTDEGRE